MKRLWLVALSGGLATMAMALAAEDASAERYASGVRAVAYTGVATRGVYRRAYRRDVRRATVAGSNYGSYWGTPGWGMGAAAMGVGTAAATTAANVGYNAYAVGSFDGGIYRRPPGYYPPEWRARVVARGLARGLTPAAMTAWSYYPTRAEYARGYASPGYFGPRCHPWIDAGCQ